MALPVLTKTWQYDVNQSIAASGTILTDNRTLMLAVKDSLIGFALSPWTVNYSCDGVVAGVAGDAVDRWNVIGDLAWDSAGNPHSWMVLQQAGLGGGQFLIDLNGFNSQNISLVFSKTGVFAGGTTLNRPTAVDEVVVLNNAAWLSSSAFSVVNVGHVVQSTDGQCTRVILCSGGFAVGTWIIDLATDVLAGWASPMIVFGGGAGSANDYPTYSNLFTAANFHGYQGADMPLYLTCEGFNNASVGQTQVYANDLDGAWPMAPCGLFCTTLGLRGRNGRVFDLWYGSTVPLTGDTYPAGVGRTFAQFGDIIVAWNGTAVVTS